MMVNVITAVPEKNDFLKRIVFYSWIALAAASTYQYTFWGTSENVICVAIVLLAWLFLSTIFLQQTMLRRYPLSSFIIIGFTATQCFFPLIFTSLEGKPVIFNLQLPIQVFFHSIASLFMLILAHAGYRLMVKRPGYKEQTIYKQSGLFDPPTVSQIWVMGIFGLFATYYAYLYSPLVANQVTGSAFDKVIQGLMPFSYAPFLIPLGRLYGNKEPAFKKLLLPLGAFTLALFLVSIARNSRGGFMIGFTSVGMAYGLGLLLGKFETKIFSLKNALVVALLFWAMTGPLADLGTAMVIVRGQRSDISYSKLVGLTLEAYGDKKAINAYRANDLGEVRDWDETYLDNIIIARFSNLKFNDMSLVQAAKLGEQDPAMIKFSMDYILATLPQPLLDALHVEIDKVGLKTISIGDYLYYRAGGPIESLGGFRTGHFAGTGMATFGWWYLLILGFGMIPVFMLFDKFFAHKKLPVSAAKSGSLYQLRFSMCGILAIDLIFRFLPTESVISTINFLLRDWIQLVMLYLLIYYITKYLTSISSFFKPQTYTKALVIKP
jgi:hypothetical protein